MLNILNQSSWTDTFSSPDQTSAIAAIESGDVIYLPQLLFPFNANDEDLLTPTILSKKSPKNVSFDLNTGLLKGAVLEGERKANLIAMMSRFAKNSKMLVETLVPHYHNKLIQGRTSFRPVEIEGRKTSILRDDTRIHVDAFPATPNHGKRILRVFTNVNPVGKGRLWHLGEPFENVVEQFKPKLKKPLLGSRKFLSLLNITKSYRSLYDHYMLTLHNQMKLSDVYQREVKKTPFEFKAGSTWIVMTDDVSHAALSGQYVLEQTFYLSVDHMFQPQNSPLRILEKTFDRELIGYLP